MILARTLVALASVVLAVTSGVAVAPAHALEEPPAPPGAEGSPSEDKAGYADLPQYGGGPNSVNEQLRTDDEPKSPVFRFDTLKRNLEPYYDFKKRLQEDLGLAFGLDYTGLYMRSSNSAGEDEAASGMVRLFGSWELIGRGTDNPGSAVFKIEHRHDLGTDVTPSGFGLETGYVGVVAGPYSGQDLRLTNLYWSQRALDGNLTFVLGHVDVTDYLDVYALANPWRHFLNLAFSTGGSAIPLPNEGLGAAVGGRLGDNFYVVGGFMDTNGDPTDPGEGFETLFQDRELFSHVELGWVSSYDRRYFDNAHVTLWHVDERDEAETSDGWGANFSLTTFVDDTWMPFLRGGLAEDGGSLLERSVSTGVGYYVRERGDLVSLGLNWGRPNDDTFGSGLDDQYTAELFYRFQFSENFEITPDLQYVIDPALNPDEDRDLIFGIRARLSF